MVDMVVALVSCWLLIADAYLNMRIKATNARQDLWPAADWGPFLGARLAHFVANLWCTLNYVARLLIADDLWQLPTLSIPAPRGQPPFK